MPRITRRIEIVAFERERVRQVVMGSVCPVCRAESALLTTHQAGRLAQVAPETVRRWIAAGTAHGVRTPGGRHRICRRSLFVGGEG